MAENTVSRMILTQIWPPKFFVGFTPTRCYALFQAIIVCKAKANESNLRKWAKKLVLGPILVHLAQIQAAKNFSHNFYSVSH